jgi:hypothetical protein
MKTAMYVTDDTEATRFQKSYSLYSLIYSTRNFSFMKLRFFIQNFLHAYRRMDIMKIYTSSLARISMCVVRMDDDALMSDVVCSFENYKK